MMDRELIENEGNDWSVLRSLVNAFRSYSLRDVDKFFQVKTHIFCSGLSVSL